MQAIHPETVGLSPERLARIRPVMQRFVDEGKFAGILTLIARHGQLAHVESVGQRNLATGQPLTSDTIFRIYSMTKPITSVALMMLYEAGELLLTDPVATFIPAFGDPQVFRGLGALEWRLEPARPITIRDLLTHTAGLSYGFFADLPIEARYQAIHNVTDFNQEPSLYPTDLPMSELVEKWAQIPLAHQPGSRWRYSVATDVLGRVIEVISGQTLGEFFRTRIFEPLGMHDSGFRVPAHKVDRFAAMYTHEPGGLREIDGSSNSPFTRPRLLESGGGGLVSSAGDYWRFAQMLLNGGELAGERLLSRKTIELMRSNHIPAAQLPLRNGDDIFAGEGFGLGFGVIIDPAASQLPWSLGSYYWGGAANTTFWIDPRENLIGLLMTQFMPSSTYPVNDLFRVLAYQAIVD